jgi:hypothetical protein
MEVDDEFVNPIAFGNEGATEVNPMATVAPASPTFESEKSSSPEPPEGPNSIWEARSLYFLGVNNPARQALITMVTQKAFDYAILLAITLNSIMMAMEDPLEDSKNPSAAQKNMDVMDFVFTLFFTVEMAMKIVAFGFVVGKTTYIRSPWNQLDFFIVITSWVPILLPSFGASTRIFR